MTHLLDKNIYEIFKNIYEIPIRENVKKNLNKLKCYNEIEHLLTEDILPVFYEMKKSTIFI